LLGINTRFGWDSGYAAANKQPLSDEFGNFFRFFQVPFENVLLASGGNDDDSE
jgi:hypothetical protein